MQHAVWYFDYISPFAYLQWPRIRALSERVAFEYRPILFAGVLQRCGQKGPAEIAGKREFTYRYSYWRASQIGLPMRYPPAHPFNPLAALRLTIAAGCTPEAIDAVFAHLWQHGRRGDDVASLVPVAQSLGIDAPELALADPSVKETLHRNGRLAEADGVFGVPTIASGGELFWGEDATAMFEAFLADPGLFDDEEMRRLACLPMAAERTPR
jgi:2-hydroxychromene-2-carboxylate isomerase